MTSPGDPRVDDIDTRGGKLGRESLPGCTQRVTVGVENESRRKPAQLAATGESMPVLQRFRSAGVVPAHLVDDARRELPQPVPPAEPGAARGTSHRPAPARPAPAALHPAGEVSPPPNTHRRSPRPERSGHPPIVPDPGEHVGDVGERDRKPDPGQLAGRRPAHPAERWDAAVADTHHFATGPRDGHRDRVRLGHAQVTPGEGATMRPHERSGVFRRPPGGVWRRTGTTPCRPRASASSMSSIISLSPGGQDTDRQDPDEALRAFAATFHPQKACTC